MEAARIFEATNCKDNVERACALLLLALARVAVEDHEGARDPAEEAARITEVKFGKDCPRRACALLVLALARVATDDHEGARVAAEEAVRIFEVTVVYKDSTGRARALLVLAQVRAAAEDLGGARAAAEKVARISEATRGNIFFRSETLYVLVGIHAAAGDQNKALTAVEELLRNVEAELAIDHPLSLNVRSLQISMLKKAWTDANSHKATLEQARAEAVSSGDALRAQLSELEQSRAQAVSGADALRAAQPRSRCQTALGRHSALDEALESFDDLVAVLATAAEPSPALDAGDAAWRDEVSVAARRVSTAAEVEVARQAAEGTPPRCLNRLREDLAAHLSENHALEEELSVAGASIDVLDAVSTPEPTAADEERLTNHVGTFLEGTWQEIFSHDADAAVLLQDSESRIVRLREEILDLSTQLSDGSFPADRCALEKQRFDVAARLLAALKGTTEPTGGARGGDKDEEERDMEEIEEDGKQRDANVGEEDGEGDDSEGQEDEMQERAARAGRAASSRESDLEASSAPQPASQPVIRRVSQAGGGAWQGSSCQQCRRVKSSRLSRICMTLSTRLAQFEALHEDDLKACDSQVAKHRALATQAAERREALKVIVERERAALAEEEAAAAVSSQEASQELAVQIEKLRKVHAAIAEVVAGEQRRREAIAASQQRAAALAEEVVAADATLQEQEEVHVEAAASLERGVALRERFAAWLRAAYRSMGQMAKKTANRLRDSLQRDSAKHRDLADALIKDLERRRRSHESALQASIEHVVHLGVEMHRLEYSYPSEEEFASQKSGFDKARSRVAKQAGTIDEIDEQTKRICASVCVQLQEEAYMMSPRGEDSYKWLNSFFFTSLPQTSIATMLATSGQMSHESMQRDLSDQDSHSASLAGFELLPPASSNAGRTALEAST